MSVIDLDMQLPRPLAWRKANTSPLLAVLLATYSACQTCQLTIKVNGVGFCRDWLPAYPLDYAVWGIRETSTLSVPRPSLHRSPSWTGVQIRSPLPLTNVLGFRHGEHVLVADVYRSDSAYGTALRRLHWGGWNPPGNLHRSNSQLPLKRALRDALNQFSTSLPEQTDRPMQPSK